MFGFATGSLDFEAWDVSKVNMGGMLDSRLSSTSLWGHGRDGGDKHGMMFGSAGRFNQPLGRVQSDEHGDDVSFGEAVQSRQVLWRIMGEQYGQ